MRFAGVLMAVVSMLVALGPARAANVLDLRTEYSAASTIHTGKEVLQGRLWRTPTALRHESEGQGRQHTVIARLDRKVAWLLIPDQKLAIEFGLKDFGLPVELLTGGGIRQTPVGEETVGGRRTTKVHVERDPKPGSDGSFDGHVWTTPEGIIMKVVGTGESQGHSGRIDARFHDVKVAPQDPALFELPAGYRRLALVGLNFETLIAGMEQLEALTRLSRPRGKSSR